MATEQEILSFRNTVEDIRREIGKEIIGQQDVVEHEQELQVQIGRLAEANAGVSSLQQQRLQLQREQQRIRRTLPQLPLRGQQAR